MSDKVFILGAGFSKALGVFEHKGCNQAPPCDHDFFELLFSKYSLLDQKPLLNKYLEWIGVNKNNSNVSLEKTWTDLNIFRTFAENVSGVGSLLKILPSDNKDPSRAPGIDHLYNEMDKWEQTIFEPLQFKVSEGVLEPEKTTLVFADYELRRLVYDIYGSVKISAEGVSLKERISEIIGNSAVISFNYDSLAESFLPDHKVFDSVYYDKRRKSNCQLITNEIIKPHGSFRWKEKRRFFVSGNKAESKVTGYSSSKRSSPPFTVNKKSEIILPVIIPLFSNKIDAVFKNGKISGGKNPYKDCALSFLRMFEAVRDAKEIIIMGYSLPKTDYETRALLEKALKLTHHPRKVKVTIVTMDTGLKIDLPVNEMCYYRAGIKQYLESKCCIEGTYGTA